MNLWIGERKVPFRKGSVVNPVGVSVLIVLFFFPFLGLNFIAASEVEDVIQMVNGQYSKIKSIQGMIRREIRDGQDTQSVTGRFLIKKPDRYYVEFSDPHQIVCSNDSLCWVEKVEENVVLKFHIAKMNRFEKEALGIGGLLGLNVFDQLREGFSFSLFDTLEGNLVLSAKPKSKARLISQILVKVDPKRWVILAYEIFDLKGKLVSQTKYEDYALYGDSLLFPKRVKTKSIYGEKTLEETDSFSRLRLNQFISDDKFEFIPPKKAKIITPEGVMERR